MASDWTRLRGNQITSDRPVLIVTLDGMTNND